MATETSPGQKLTEKRKWPVTAKLLIGLLTAAGTFLGGLSALLALSNADLQRASARADAKVSSAQTVIVNLQGDKDDLQSKYRDLSNQAAAAPGDVAAPTGDVLPTGVTPRHDDAALTIQSGEAVDLDAPPSDPRWENGDNQDDLRFDDGVISGNYRGKILALVSGTDATYKTCNTSGFSDSTRLSVRETTTAGDFFCVQTSSNRIAAAKITKLDEATVVLSIRVWNSPESR